MSVPTDSIVLCHTSLRSVGEIDGRGETLLGALIEHCTSGGGLLAVPTHTWAFVGRKDLPTVDMLSPETCIGTLPSIAAVYPGVHRSLHPTHSMAVFGDDKKAAAFIAGEAMSDTSTHPRGCYGRLRENNGSILLIGVGLDKNTYMHSCEEMMDVPDRLTDHHVPMTIRLESGDIIDRPLRHHNSTCGNVSDRYPKYEDAFRHHGIIRDGMIGSAPSMLLSAAKIFDVMQLIRERSGGAELLGDDLPFAKELYE